MTCNNASCHCFPQHYAVTNVLLDFEQTFAPELASLMLPRQTVSSPTPVPSWTISPSPSKKDISQGSLAMPMSLTNGTIDTSILDSPHHSRTHSKRLSLFLSRNSSVDDSDKEKRKDNRRSFFSGNGLSMNGISMNGHLHNRGREMSREEIPEEQETGDLQSGGEWVTQSDLSMPGLGNSPGRRSSSSQRRPDTASSGMGTGMGMSVGSKVDSVRKRFSVLRLGKKGSTIGSNLGSVDVVEE